LIFISSNLNIYPYQKLKNSFKKYGYHSAEVSSTNYRWFKAIDVPKKDKTPFRKTSDNKVKPSLWEPFDEPDSNLIEEKFQNLKLFPNTDPLVVPLSSDGLLEINVEQLEIYPGLFLLIKFIGRVRVIQFAEEFGLNQKAQGGVISLAMRI
jgi:hypothetical protein